MNFKLTVYSHNVYQEYALPRLEEGACRVKLSASSFGLRKDLRLNMEVRSGRPAFLPSGDFSLRPAGGKRRFPLPIKVGAVYFLTPGGGGRLVLVLRTMEDTSLIQYFALDDGFSIGSAPENHVIYGGGGTVSKTHAVLTQSEGGWELEDRSSNGVYINSRRVEGSQFLKSGDLIHICGLTAIYLEDRIALNAATPGLRIQEGLTSLENGEIAEEFDQSNSKAETVFEPQDDSEAETVFEPQDDSEAETVFEPQDSSEAETVFEPQDDSETETVLEPQDDSEAETVFEPQNDSEAETVFERLDKL